MSVTAQTSLKIVIHSIKLPSGPMSTSDNTGPDIHFPHHSRSIVYITLLSMCHNATRIARLFPFYSPALCITSIKCLYGIITITELLIVATIARVSLQILNLSNYRFLHLSSVK